MSKPPAGIGRSSIKALPDGYLVVAYNEAEVTQMWSGQLIVSVPVAYYSEEWDWLDGGVVFIGAEDHESVINEATHALGLTSLTGSP